jgi:hypothetical protein
MAGPDAKETFAYILVATRFRSFSALMDLEGAPR